MSSGYYDCPLAKGVHGACDLDGPREYLCEHCLTKLIRSERPAGWSPVVKKSETKRANKCGHGYSQPAACPVCISSGMTVEFEDEDE